MPRTVVTGDYNFSYYKFSSPGPYPSRAAAEGAIDELKPLFDEWKNSDDFSDHFCNWLHCFYVSIDADNNIAGVIPFPREIRPNTNTKLRRVPTARVLRGMMPLIQEKIPGCRFEEIVPTEYPDMPWSGNYAWMNSVDAFSRQRGEGGTFIAYGNSCNFAPYRDIQVEHRPSPVKTRDDLIRDTTPVTGMWESLDEAIDIYRSPKRNEAKKKLHDILTNYVKKKRSTGKSKLPNKQLLQLEIASRITMRILTECKFGADDRLVLVFDCYRPRKDKSLKIFEKRKNEFFPSGDAPPVDWTEASLTAYLSKATELLQKKLAPPGLDILLIKGEQPSYKVTSKPKGVHVHGLHIVLRTPGESDEALRNRIDNEATELAMYGSHHREKENEVEDEEEEDEGEEEEGDEDDDEEEEEEEEEEEGEEDDEEEEEEEDEEDEDEEDEAVSKYLCFGDTEWCRIVYGSMLDCMIIYLVTYLMKIANIHGKQTDDGIRKYLAKIGVPVDWNFLLKTYFPGPNGGTLFPTHTLTTELPPFTKAGGKFCCKLPGFPPVRSVLETLEKPAVLQYADVHGRDFVACLFSFRDSRKEEVLEGGRPTSRGRVE